MHQRQYIKYGIRLCFICVYSEPVLRRARKETNTQKETCTVSRSKQSAAEKVRIDTCTYGESDNIYVYEKIYIEMYSETKICVNRYICKKKVYTGRMESC
jgi:hypothetical protein